MLLIDPCLVGGHTISCTETLWLGAPGAEVKSMVVEHEAYVNAYSPEPS